MWRRKRRRRRMIMLDSWLEGDQVKILLRRCDVMLLEHEQVGKKILQKKVLEEVHLNRVHI
jgi:hypothetical protein